MLKDAERHVGTSSVATFHTNACGRNFRGAKQRFTHEDLCTCLCLTPGYCNCERNRNCNCEQNCNLETLKEDATSRRVRSFEMTVHLLRSSILESLSDVDVAGHGLVDANIGLLPWVGEGGEPFTNSRTCTNFLLISSANRIFRTLDRFFFGVRF